MSQHDLEAIDCGCRSLLCLYFLLKKYLLPPYDFEDDFGLSATTVEGKMFVAGADCCW